MYTFMLNPMKYIQFINFLKKVGFSSSILKATLKFLHDALLYWWALKKKILDIRKSQQFLWNSIISK